MSAEKMNIEFSQTTGNDSFFANIQDINLSQFDKLQRNLMYWDSNFRFLVKPNTVVFTGLQQGNVMQIDITKIMKHLVFLEAVNYVKGLHLLNNTAFLFIEFSNNTIAAMFQNKSTQIDGVKTHFVNMEGPIGLVNITIDKLPPSVLEKYLPKILEKWGNIVAYQPALMQLPAGNKCTTGATKVVLRLKAEYNKTDLPYFIKIENLRTYLHIPGRPKICFKCESLEHLVSSCPFKFCPICKMNKVFPHQCRPSYAGKAGFLARNWTEIFNKINEEIVSERLGLEYDKDAGSLKQDLYPSQVVVPLRQHEDKNFEQYSDSNLIILTANEVIGGSSNDDKMGVSPNNSEKHLESQVMVNTQMEQYAENEMILSSGTINDFGKNELKVVSKKKSRTQAKARNRKSNSGIKTYSLRSSIEAEKTEIKDSGNEVNKKSRSRSVSPKSDRSSKFSVDSQESSGDE